LYLKQLEDRLGEAAVENIAMPEQRQGTIYSILDGWKGNGNLSNHYAEHLASPENFILTGLETGTASQFIELSWTDNVPNETWFILERSDDGGAIYVQIATLPANTVSYKDENIEQATYHYRLKAVNETLESKYIYLFVDMFDELLYADITFNVNLSDVTDLYDEGSVWLVTYPENSMHEMTKEDNDSVWSINRGLSVGSNLVYKFAYQNGTNPSSDIVTEQNPGDCANSEGYRQLAVPEDDLILDPLLFGTCDVDMPPGIDVTNLEGTIIIGSNDHEPWIDASTGAGSPPNERVENLIDNDINTKYLVRAVSSWMEIEMNRFSKLTGYTITSANDAPSRDPRSWQLKGWDDNADQWVTLHTVNDNPEWNNRFKAKVWTFDNINWYSRYRLYITEINGNEQDLMQMAEWELYGETAEYVGTTETENPEIRVFPNPVQGPLNIEWTGQIINPEVALYDVTGRMIYSTIIRSYAEFAVRLNTEKYPKGLYILQVKYGGTVIRQKVIIE
jgi:hypothetical protein